MERYSSSVAGVASGTDKTILSLIDTLATPTRRGEIYDILIGCSATPADQACLFNLARITTAGTSAANYTPNNIDPAGPAGELLSGQGVFSAEPTYTANKELLRPSINQRATFRWIANEGSEFKCAATQNNGLGLKSKASTSTQAYDVTFLFRE